MANDDFPRGFVPLNTGGKGTVNSHYYIASTAADLAVGQPVAIDANGQIVAIGESGATVCLGVALGFSIGKAGSHELDPFLDVSDLTTNDVYVQVADDPFQEYYIQEDTGGTALTAAAVGAGIDCVWHTTRVTAVTGVPALEIDASSVAATTATFVRILRLLDLVNSDGTQNAVGDYAKWVVQFMHPQKGGISVQGVI